MNRQQNTQKITDVTLPDNMAKEIITLKNNSGKGFVKDLIIWAINSFENPEKIRSMLEQRICFSSSNVIVLKTDSGANLPLTNFIDTVKNAKGRLGPGIYLLKETCFRLMVENAKQTPERMVLQNGAQRRMFNVL